MSLLSDALNRRRQERGGDTSFPPISGAEQNAAPESWAKESAPPALPKPKQAQPAVVEEGKAPPAQEWVAGVLVAIGLLVVLAGLGLPYYYFIVRIPSEPGEGQPVEQQTVALIEPEPAPVMEPALVEVESPPETVAVEPERTEPETLDELPMDEVVVPAPDMPRSEPDLPRAEPEAVKWPDLRVQAAMGSGGTGSVLIDGEITPVGGRYREVLIREITPHGVLLEYQGEERMVRVRR